MSGHVKWTVGICVLVTTVFCASFVLLYTRWHRRSRLPAFPARLEGQAFPAARFTNLAGSTLDDHLLRTGRVVLTFIAPDCDACDVESQFLRTLVNKRSDIRFYGIIPVGDRKSSLTAASQPNKYPFETYFDDDHVYMRASRAVKVPVKIFLQDGIVRRTWEGASMTEAEKLAFSKWLEDLR